MRIAVISDIHGNHNNYKDAWYNIPDEDWEAALNKLGIWKKDR